MRKYIMFCLAFCFIICFLTYSQTYRRYISYSDVDYEMTLLKLVDSTFVYYKTITTNGFSYYFLEGNAPNYNFYSNNSSVNLNTINNYIKYSSACNLIGQLENYYVFTFSVKGSLRKGVVFNLLNAPIQINSASISDYSGGKTVSVTFSTSKPTDQKAYVIYSRDNYLTRKIAQITNAENRTNGSISIPSTNFNDGIYTFYVIISPMDLNTLNSYSNQIDIDACTIAFNNVLGVNTPLPVELASFTGKVKGSKVILSWETATEVSNLGFEVEQSTDKVNWSKIGFVNGNGNSNSPKSYSFEVSNFLKTNLYYRLKQIDTDGKFKYSPVVEINKNNLVNSFSISQNFPNPFNPNTNIEFSVSDNMQVDISVYNILGEKVASLYNGNAKAGRVYSASFNGANLPSGVYLYRLTTPYGTTTKKMMLNK